MFLVTPPNGPRYVTDCEQAVLERECKLSGATFEEIEYIPTISIRKILWERRAAVLNSTNMDAAFPDRRVKGIDAKIAAAIAELETEGL